MDTNPTVEFSTAAKDTGTLTLGASRGAHSPRPPTTPASASPPRALALPEFQGEVRALLYHRLREAALLGFGGFSSC